MAGKWLVTWLCLPLAFSLCAGPAEASEKMSLHLENASLPAVIQTLASMTGENVVFSGDIKGTVTADFRDMNPENALEQILLANHLAVEKRDRTLLIFGKKESDSGAESIRAFPLSYARAEEVADNLAAVLPEGAVSANAASNLVIVRASPVDLLHAEDMVELMDRPEKQARVEAQVLAVNKSSSKELGIDWDFKSLTGSARYTRDSWTERRPARDSSGNLALDREGNVKMHRIEHDGWTVTAPEGYAGLSYGHSITGHPYTFFFQAKLNALVTEGKAKVLARPNIVTLNGREAKILIGSQIPVLVEHTENGEKTTTVEYKDAGISLSYKPVISRDNEITARIDAEVSTPYLVPEMKAYRIVTRKANTMVRIHSGDVITIGGLIDREESDAFRKVPILGDIPILGKLFQSRHRQKEESEIIIALKADVLDEEKAVPLQRTLYREQDNGNT